MSTRPYLSISKIMIVAAGSVFLIAAHAGDKSDARARKQAIDRAAPLLKAISVPCTITDARPIASGARGGALSSIGTESAGMVGGGMGQGPSGGGGGMGGGMGGPTPLGGAGAAPSEDIGGRWSNGPWHIEVACAEGPGYIVSTDIADPTRPSEVAKQIDPAVARLCVELASGVVTPGISGRLGTELPPGTSCALPPNSVESQNAMIAGYFAKTNTHCDIEHARAVGHGKNNAVFEVSCKGAIKSGFLISTLYPLNKDASTAATSCLTLPANAKVQCQLTDTAAVFSAADALVTSQSPQCKISNRKFMAISGGGDYLFEYLCESKENFILVQKSDGTAGGLASCASKGVEKLDGGCKLAATP